MADLDATVAIPLGLTVLAGVVAALEKLSRVRRDWRLRPMKQQSTDDASDVPLPSRRGHSLTEHEPLTRAEIEARLDAIVADVARLEAIVAKVDDRVDRFEVETVRGIGGINTRLETLRGRIAGVYELVTRSGGRGGRR
jgi:hypothetical protein